MIDQLSAFDPNDPQKAPNVSIEKTGLVGLTHREVGNFTLERAFVVQPESGHVTDSRTVCGHDSQYAFEIRVTRNYEYSGDGLVPVVDEEGEKAKPVLSINWFRGPDIEVVRVGEDLYIVGTHSLVVPKHDHPCRYLWEEYVAPFDKGNVWGGEDEKLLELFAPTEV